MQDRFSRFSFYVLITGIIAALFMVINGILHTNVSSKIQNKPADMIGPNAKF